MTINSTHPDYDATLPAWLRARDVLAGEDAVKAAGVKYLPRLDSQNDEEYAAYVARASFFGATTRTLEEYLDLVFRRAPAVGLCATAGEPSEAMKAFAADCDGWGTAFVRYARRVVAEVLSVGRAGSLVVWDPPSHGSSGAASPRSDGGSGAANQNGKPCVSLWRAEEILNWEVARSEGRTVLTCVVLKDGDRVRVLRLNGTDRTNGTDVSSGNQGPWCTEEVWGPKR